MILACRNLADEILAKARSDWREVPRNFFFALISTGEDPASQVYLKHKIADAARCGISYKLFDEGASGETFTNDDLRTLIAKLNADQDCVGIIVQVPLGPGLSPEIVEHEISPAKDLDGLTWLNQGLLHSSRTSPLFLPATVSGILSLLGSQKIELAGARVAVVGRSNLVGRPMISTLIDKGATVTACHSQTKDLASVTREASVIITATGQPGLITMDHVSPGAVVIDVGITKTPSGMLVGDVSPEVVEDEDTLATLVPGGVGLLTRAALIRNVVHSAQRRLVGIT